MKKFIGVLLLIWAGGWFVSCVAIRDGTVLDVQELGLGVVKGCENTQGAAVSITVNNNVENAGLKVRHRVNNDDWKQDQVIDEVPIIINGPAGKYEIEVRKEGYPLQTAIVDIPQEKDCGILQQELNFSIAPPLCPPLLPVVSLALLSEPPDEAGLNVMINAGNGYQNSGLSVALKTPNNSPPPSPCNTNNSCYVSIEFNSPGDYVVEFSGFQDYRKMKVIDGIVHYAYTDVMIEIDAGVKGNKIIVSEGISDMRVTVPFKFGDSGCHEVLFDKIDVITNHVESSYSHTVETRENLSYRIENYPSDFCPGQPPNSVNFIEMNYDVLLPAGTRISDVTVEYWLDNSWKQASCTDIIGYQCKVMYPNPLYGSKYQVRTTIKDQEYIGSSVSLGDNCIVFEQPGG